MMLCIKLLVLHRVILGTIFAMYFYVTDFEDFANEGAHRDLMEKYLSVAEPGLISDRKKIRKKRSKKPREATDRSHRSTRAPAMHAAFFDFAACRASESYLSVAGADRTCPYDSPAKNREYCAHK